MAIDQIHWVFDQTITIPTKAWLKKENDNHRELLCSFYTGILAVLCIDFSDSLSCDTANKLDMGIFANSCPANQCKTSGCLKQCVPKIKSDIASKFGSAPSLLNVTTSNGTSLSCSIQFCSFDPVISGKRDDLKYTQKFCLWSRISIHLQQILLDILILISFIHLRLKGKMCNT